MQNVMEENFPACFENLKKRAIAFHIDLINAQCPSRCSMWAIIVAHACFCLSWIDNNLVCTRATSSLTTNALKVDTVNIKQQHTNNTRLMDLFITLQIPSLKEHGCSILQTKYLTIVPEDVIDEHKTQV